MSLIKFCPACGSQPFTAHDQKHWRCSACDFQYFHNMASASAAIIRCADEILLVRRRFNPGQGLLDLPGGFVDYGESIEQGMTREVEEELGVRIEDWQYLFSFPNQYRYAEVLYHTQDAFFTAELDQKPKIVAKDDVAEAIWVKRQEIMFNDIAFSSVRNALKQYCARAE